MTVTTEQIDVGGATLHAEIRGTGQPFVFVHGGAEDSESYVRAADALAAEHTVVTYDRRGTGRSGRGGWPCEVGTHASDLAALIDALELDQPTVFGCSSGGVVLLHAIGHHGDRIGRAIVYEPAAMGSFRAGHEFTRMAMAAANEAVEANGGSWVDGYRVFYNLPSPGAWERTSPERRAIEGRNAETFLRDDLPKISASPPDLDSWRAARVDARLAFGTSSPDAIVGMALVLAGELGWPLHEMADVGHTPYLNVPEEFAAWLRSEGLSG